MNCKTNFGNRGEKNNATEDTKVNLQIDIQGPFTHKGLCLR